MTIEIVFFDAGETLIHPHPSFPELFVRVCGANGFEVDVSDVEEVQQRLAPHLVELAQETGIEKPSLDANDSLIFWSHLYRRLLGELGIEDDSLVGEMYSTFSSSSSYRLFDDALPALTELKTAGYRLGLISNFEQWLEEMLVELEVGHIFETSIISGVEGLEKPDPEIYRRALEHARVAPEGAVHVGDSPKLDVEPARSVGMRAVLLDRYDRYGDLAGPRVRSLSELGSLIGSL
ncbi:MAG: HAD family hydrolase [Actinomycetota bacterium]